MAAHIQDIVAAEIFSAQDDDFLKKLLVSLDSMNRLFSDLHSYGGDTPHL